MKTYFTLIFALVQFNISWSQKVHTFHADTNHIKSFKKSLKYQTINNKGCIIKPKFDDAQIPYLKSAFVLACKDSNALNHKQIIETEFKGTDVIEHHKSHSLQLSCSNGLITNDPFNNTYFSANPQRATAHLDMLNIKCAWSITQGDPNLIIGIADTDFDINHPDLLGKFTSSTQSFTQAQKSTHPFSAHGVKLSGVIGAIANNGLGVAGIASNCKMDGQSFDGTPIYAGTGGNGYIDISNGSTRYIHNTDPDMISTSDIANAINRCFNNGARIINVSQSSANLTRAEAQAFIDHNVVFVVASTTYQIDGKEIYENQAFENLPGALLVGKVDYNGNVGDKRLEENICGLGDRIMTTNYSDIKIDGFDQGYNGMSDNSSATAQITGIVALVRSVNPCLTPTEVTQIVISTASSPNNKSSLPSTYTAGIADAYAAVLKAISMTDRVSKTYFQNQVISSNPVSIYTAVAIGSDVTNTTNGAVSVASGSSWTINSRETYIKNDFTVPLGAEFTANPSLTIAVSGCQ